MPLPLVAVAGGAMAGGKILGGVSDLIGGNAAQDDLSAGLDKSRTDLNAGFNQAKGYNQPVYDKALGAYSNLNDKYAAGGFSNPHMDPYHQDPNAVFQDPEYQAQMRSGMDGINNSAAAKGMLFSGVNDRDLTKFGQDTFAGRSDALYNRGFNATNTAFNQNAQSNLNSFNMGAHLMSPLADATSNLSNLATGQGASMSENDMNQANVQAGGDLRTSNILGGMAGDLGGIGSDYFSNLAGQENIFRPKSNQVTLSIGNGK